MALYMQAKQSELLNCAMNFFGGKVYLKLETTPRTDTYSLVLAETLQKETVIIYRSLSLWSTTTT